MYFYNEDKDDPSNFDTGGYYMDNNSNNQLFGQSFDDFYDDNSFLNFDMQQHSHSLPTSFFFPPTNDMQQQEHSILFSDPNFLRQQQLLEKAEVDTRAAGGMTLAKEEEEIATQQHDSSMVRSNLSAMLGQQQQQQQQQIQLESIPRKRSSQPSKSTMMMNSGEGSVDHHRRFTELQARFRVNYNNKKTQKQQLEDNATLNRRKSSMEPTLNNKNILKLNNRESRKVNTSSNNTKKVTNNASINGTSSMNIPNSNSNPSSSSSASASHSFPSRTMPIQIQRVHRANANQPFDLEQRQKRLDDQLVKVDFNDITVSELKEMLRQRGKPATGKKAILLQRLQEERDFIQQARANGVPISNRYLNQQQQQSPVMDSSSLPESMFLSSSPASLGSLNRSIANMHIGSPPPNSLTIPSQPVNSNRRFTPYTSPRNSLSSPSYSTSVPTTSGHVYKKSYAPFTSSALATPDRDDDYNPFDNMENTNTEEAMNDIEWTDPSLEAMLQQQGSVPKLTDEEILSFLSSSRFDISNNNNHNYFHQQTLDEQIMFNNHHHQ
ncbi:hypothetical protein G6F46_008642 [Rhizopus delemar]|nr:hypothetical protein G6F55_007641 [Rhizopus delemar]KAG1539736.1 hypothetical protein G6F51_008956 [Rhizopus arrhizus]KAG1494053.1 hypothetical protein G6F54_008151 [Rhizopus delemar]KAG1508171.1 hypothetical protein G6F53_008398 [Rhizopus delemar]KAG1521420.1 hypothetical protein G6F52_006764 [Rhizopus delemar]